MFSRAVQLDLPSSPAVRGDSAGALYSCTRHLVLASWLAVLLLLAHLEAVFTLGSALAVCGLLAALWGAHCFYRHRTDTRCLAVALGALALLMAAGGAAGAISQLGLALHMPLLDPVLAEADKLLGFSSPAVIEWIVGWRNAPQLLGLAYVSSFPLLFGSAIVLGLRGEEQEAWELCFVFAATIMLCACFAAVFPAQGAFPYYNLGPGLASSLPPGSGIYHLPAMEYFRNSEDISLDALRLQGVVTFPSFHTALALMTAFAWRHHRKIFFAMIGWNALVIVSTIPIGGHYGIDLIGGALLWAALAWSSARVAAQGPAPTRDQSP